MALDGILDTRFYFAYFAPEDESSGAWTKSVVAKAKQGQLRLASSVVTLTELYLTMGRDLGLEVVRNRIASLRNVGISFIDLEESEADVAGRIALKQSGLPIADCMIAATCLVHARGTILTNDSHFEQIDGVRTRWLRGP